MTAPLDHTSEDCATVCWTYSDEDDVPALLHEIADRLVREGAALISVFNSPDDDTVQVIADVG